MSWCRTRRSTSLMETSRSTSAPRNWPEATSRQPSPRRSGATSTSKTDVAKGSTRVTVRVGPKAGRKVRFTGVLLGTWGNNTTAVNVYRSRSGKFVIHTQRTADWSSRDAQGNPGGWRSWLGLGDFSWLGSTGDSTLEVVATVDELREKLPPDLFELVAGVAKQPAVEDLDI